jgi:hypothetical protein
MYDRLSTSTTCDQFNVDFDINAKESPQNLSNILIFAILNFKCVVHKTWFEFKSFLFMFHSFILLI